MADDDVGDGDHEGATLNRKARRSYNVVYHDAVPSVELHQDLRHAVRDLCKAFPDSYWRELDAKRAYPDAFVKALTEAGYLAALIPEAYGGSGLGIGEAAIVGQGSASGGNAPPPSHGR